MGIKTGRFVILATLVLIAVTFGFSHTLAEEKKDMQGWEIDSPYNRLYDVREYEKIRAWVIRVKEVIPMPGMSPAITPFRPTVISKAQQRATGTELQGQNLHWMPRKSN